MTKAYILVLSIWFSLVFGEGFCHPYLIVPAYIYNSTKDKKKTRDSSYAVVYREPLVETPILCLVAEILF